MHQVQIRVRAEMNELWSEWLGGLSITHPQEDETLLSGSLADQAALYAVMSKLHDLGLPLAALTAQEERATS